MATSKRGHNELNLEKKIDLIKASEAVPKPRQDDLSKKFGIGRSTVSDILRKRSLYLEAWESNRALKCQRIVKTTPTESLNELLYSFFSQARDKNIPISGPILQSKALMFADELGIEDFKASNGWLTSWKKRYNIKQLKISGESADVDLDVVEDFKKRLPDFISHFKPEDVFNCDETGLFYRALPDKTLERNRQDVKGGKLCKERLTVLLACSSVGEKLKPLIIGKSAKPRALKGIDTNQLGVSWRSNSKAWMNSKVFSDWLQDLNRRMKLHKRKILLYMDNVSSHTSSADVSLSNVTVKFFPANTTSCLQPLDAGIIKTFKVLFRKHLLSHILARMDSCNSATELSKQVNVLHALNWIVQSWRSISPEKVKKCFTRCGFKWAEVEQGDSLFQELAKEELQSMMDTAATLGMETGVTSDDYVNFEDGIQTESLEGWEEDLLEEFRAANNLPGSTADEEVDEEEVPIQEATPTTREVLDYLGKVSTYLSCHNPDLLETCCTLVQEVERKLIKERESTSVQSTLDNYFKS